jgi:tetratricopeptide (TPR) repeat protein
LWTLASETAGDAPVYEVIAMRRDLWMTLVCAATVLSLTCLGAAQSSLSTSSSSAGSAGSESGDLKIGDPAPGLDVIQWYPDEAQKIEPGMCYIIDFYSLLAPECKKSLPYLAGLQQIFRNRGLKVIGITKDPDEVVQATLQWNRDIEFHTVGADREEKTTRAWQKASKREKIPTSFVVDRNGRIVHIGNPLDENFFSIVQLTVLDRYDPKLFARVMGGFSAARRAAKIKNYKEAYRLIDETMKEDPRILSTFAVEKLEIMLTQEKNYVRGYEYAREMLKTYEGDPYTLSEVATLIATNPKVENRDFQIAMAHVDRAIELSKGQEPIYLSNKALVLNAKGDVDEAIRFEIDAWKLAVPLEKPYHKRKLDEYKKIASVKASGGAIPAPAPSQAESTPGSAAKPK